MSIHKCCTSLKPATDLIDDRKNLYKTDTNGLYYKPITIVNDDSSIVNKLETSLIDDARVIIYDRHMSIVQATEFDITALTNAAAY